MAHLTFYWDAWAIFDDDDVFPNDPEGRLRR